MATFGRGAPRGAAPISPVPCPASRRWAGPRGVRSAVHRPVPFAFETGIASAGLLSFVVSAFGTFPVLLAVAGRLGLGAGQAATWLVVACVVGALTSAACALAHRQPLNASASVSALVFYGSVAGQFSLPDLAGAALVAAVLIALLGWSRALGRLLPALPLPILMAMFAGTVFAVVSRLVAAPLGDPRVAGATLAAYLAGRALRRPQAPPLGVAMLGGLLACALGGDLGATGLAWVRPEPFLVAPHFSPAAVLAVGLPLVVFCTVGGNVPAFSALLAHDYRPPVDRLLVATGLASVAQALVGLSPMALTRDTVALLAGPDAGPAPGRYRASLVNAALFLAAAGAAGPLVALLGALPAGYLATLAALAVLPAFQNALAQAFGGPARLGPTAAFLTAATPFTLAGLPAPFWGIVVGLVIVVAVERPPRPRERTDRLPEPPDRPAAAPSGAEAADR